ncbi:copper fist DNA binding domain-containing protein [Aspergillus pseudoustus]|uniref:Copper fist DNA binding domain-containing protein n=1 Tax=Aspergillus pseudoustus TaxID=1810923 RepID=A0ABR4JW87_9EURO
MLIDGEKWACEACVRGHRVSTCKHHDRPLIRINRKGRPFSTCSICNCTPCNSPDEHNRLKREAELKSQSQNRASGRHARSNPSAFLPIAPRPTSSSSPPSATQSSRQGYTRGSQSSDAATLAPRAGAVGAGERGAPQGAPRHRSSNSTARSSAPRATQHQHQQQHYTPGPSHYGSLSPLSMPLGSFSPPLCSMSDIPGSMSMVNPFEHPYGDPSMLDGSGGAAAFPSLEDFDLGPLQDDMIEEDWRWFSDDHNIR